MSILRRQQSREASEALASLRDAPGPSPWYLRVSGAPVISNSTESFTWSDAGATPPLLGKTLLTTSGGVPVAILGLYCFVQVVDRKRFMFWHRDDLPSLGPLGKGKAIRVSLVDADLLKPIPDVREGCEAMDAVGESIHMPSGVVESTLVAAGLEAGEHAHEFPAGFAGIEEILILDSHTQLQLLILRPRLQRLEVFPQDWFNDGKFDFGYQSVARVSRERSRGRVIGEGIRLGVFELDDSNRRVARWFIEDPFYGPGR